MKEHEAIDFLRTRLTTEGYEVIPQVGSGTGAAYRRTADALAVQTWPSRGIAFTGVEYKRTVADFRRELAEPEKADEIARFCDYWVILAPKGIVSESELPHAWGLWEIKNDKLYRTKQPEKQDAKAPTHTFVAAILRAAAKASPVFKAAESAKAKAYEDGRKAEQSVRAHELERYKTLQGKVQEFENASGLRIEHGWDLEKLGRDVRQYINADGETKDRLYRLLDTTTGIANYIDKAIAQLPTPTPMEGER